MSTTENRIIADDDDNAEPVARTVARPAAEKKVKGPYPNRRKITAYINRDLFFYLKSIGVKTDRTMVSLLEEALTQYVNTYAAQSKFKG